MNGIIVRDERAARAALSNCGWRRLQPFPISGGNSATRTFCMSQPLVVTIPHRLGREEAARRLKSGLATARANYSALLAIHEETWTGDRLAFHVSAIGQNANRAIDVADDHVPVEGTPP